MLSNKIPTLADNLKILRKQKGWSQQRLAQEAGITFTVVTKIEQGVTKDPGISSLVKIAGGLGVSLDALVGWTPPSAPADVESKLPQGRRAGR